MRSTLSRVSGNQTNLNAYKRTKLGTAEKFFCLTRNKKLNRKTFDVQSKTLNENGKNLTCSGQQIKISRQKRQNPNWIKWEIIATQWQPTGGWWQILIKFTVNAPRKIGEIEENAIWLPEKEQLVKYFENFEPLFLWETKWLKNSLHKLIQFLKKYSKIKLFVFPAQYFTDQMTIRAGKKFLASSVGGLEQEQSWLLYWKSGFLSIRPSISLFLSPKNFSQHFVV